MLKNKGFEILISSDLQYEELCSEIYFEGQFVAVITRENGLERAVIRIDPPPHSQHWTFECSSFVKILKEAKKNLIRIDESEKQEKTPSSMGQFRITVPSLPDRENLVAEIAYDGVQWAEISQETDEMIVQLYAHPRQQFWEFSLNEALLALEKAKQRLMDLGDKRT